MSRARFRIVRNLWRHVVFVRVEHERQFGERVRELRQARDWTQGELANRMTAAGYSMHQTTIAKIESGNRPTNVGEVTALASLLGVSVADLFPDEDDEAAEMRAEIAELGVRRERLLQDRNSARAHLAAVEGYLAETEDEWRSLSVALQLLEDSRRQRSRARSLVQRSRRTNGDGEHPEEA